MPLDEFLPPPPKPKPQGTAAVSVIDTLPPPPPKMKATPSPTAPNAEWEKAKREYEAKNGPLPTSDQPAPEVVDPETRLEPGMVSNRQRPVPRGPQDFRADLDPVSRIATRLTTGTMKYGANLSDLGGGVARFMSGEPNAGEITINGERVDIAQRAREAAATVDTGFKPSILDAVESVPATLGTLAAGGPAMKAVTKGGQALAPLAPRLAGAGASIGAAGAIVNSPEEVIRGEQAGLSRVGQSANLLASIGAEAVGNSATQFIPGLRGIPLGEMALLGTPKRMIGPMIRQSVVDIPKAGVEGYISGAGTQVMHAGREKLGVDPTKTFGQAASEVHDAGLGEALIGGGFQTVGAAANIVAPPAPVATPAAIDTLPPPPPKPVSTPEQQDKDIDDFLNALNEELKHQADPQSAAAPVVPVAPAVPGQAPTAAPEPVVAPVPVSDLELRGVLFNARHRPGIQRTLDGTGTEDLAPMMGDEVDVELDRLEGLAARGKLTQERWNNSRFARHADILSMHASHRVLAEEGPEALVRRLRALHQPAAPAAPAPVRALSPEAQAEVDKLPPETRAAIQSDIDFRTKEDRDVAGDLGNIQMAVMAAEARAKRAAKQTTPQVPPQVTPPAPAREAVDFAAQTERDRAAVVARGGPIKSEPVAAPKKTVSFTPVNETGDVVNEDDIQTADDVEVRDLGGDVKMAYRNGKEVGLVLDESDAVADAKPDAMPSLDTMVGLHGLERAGRPGYAEETKAGDDAMRRTFVYRDEKGEPKGTLVAWTLEDDSRVEVVVDPALRRQGIATKLFDAAKAAGVDVERLSAAKTNSLTPDGRAFREKRLERQAPKPAATTPQLTVPYEKSVPQAVSLAKGGTSKMVLDIPADQNHLAGLYHVGFDRDGGAKPYVVYGVDKASVRAKSGTLRGQPFRGLDAMGRVLDWKRGDPEFTHRFATEAEAKAAAERFGQKWGGAIRSRGKGPAIDAAQAAEVASQKLQSEGAVRTKQEAAEDADADAFLAANDPEAKAKLDAEIAKADDAIAKLDRQLDNVESEAEAQPIKDALYKAKVKRKALTSKVDAAAAAPKPEAPKAPKPESRTEEKTKEVLAALDKDRAATARAKDKLAAPTKDVDPRTLTQKDLDAEITTAVDEMPDGDVEPEIAHKAARRLERAAAAGMKLRGLSREQEDRYRVLYGNARDTRMEAEAEMARRQTPPEGDSVNHAFGGLPIMLGSVPMTGAETLVTTSSASGALLPQWWEPVIQTVARHAAQLGQDLRKHLDRWRTLQGELAMVRRKALKAVQGWGIWSKTGRDLNAAVSSTQAIEWNGQSGFARIQKIIEDPSLAINDESKIVEAYKDPYYATGRQAEKAKLQTTLVSGQKVLFKVDPNQMKFVRLMTEEFDDVLHTVDSQNYRVLVDELARLNNMPVGSIELVLGELRDAATRNVALEKARSLKVFPTHIRVGGRTIPLLHTRPYPLIANMLESFPARTAFWEVFGQRDLEQVMSEYRRVSGGDDQAIVRALRAAHNMSPEINQVFGRAQGVAKTMGEIAVTILGVRKVLKLTRSFVPNLFEPLSKTRAYGGSVRAMRALWEMAADGRSVMIETERLGARTQEVLDWTGNPDSIGETVRRYARQISLRIPTIVNEFNEAHAAVTGLVMARDLKAGRVSALDTQRLKQLNFTPAEVSSMIAGTAGQDLYQAMVQRFVEASQGSTSKKGDKSRAGNSTTYGTLINFDSYAQHTASETNRLVRGLVSTARESGMWSAEMTKAVAFASDYFIGHAAAGAGALLLRAFMIGGAAALLMKWNEAEEEPVTFIKEATTSAMFGGPMEGMRQWLAGERTMDSAITNQIAPLGAIREMQQTFANFQAVEKGDMAWRFAAEKALETQIPLAGSALTFISILGGDKKAAELDAALAAYFTFRRKHAPTFKTETPGKLPTDADAAAKVETQTRFRENMTSAAEAIRRGQDPSGFIQKALDLKDRGHRDYLGAISSLGGKRLFEDLDEAQVSRLRRTIGEAAYANLVVYDRTIERWQAVLAAQQIDAKKADAKNPEMRGAIEADRKTMRIDREKFRALVGEVKGALAPEKRAEIDAKLDAKKP